MNIRMDHDRLQLFISFQHAGYEVVASEHIVMHILGDLVAERNSTRKSH